MVKVVLDIPANIKITIMRSVLYIFFLTLLFSSCRSQKPTSVQPVNSIEKAEKATLNEGDQRKFDYYFYEALRERLAGNFDQAGMFFSECLKIDATSSVVFYEVAKLLLMEEDYNRAQTLLELAVKYESSNIWYLQMLGDVYQHNKKTKEAIGVYENVVSLFPDNEQYLYVLSMLYKENKEYEQAILMLDRLQNKVGIIDMLTLEKQQLYLQVGKQRQAYNELQQYVNKYPHDSKGYAFMGDYYLQLNDLTKAWQFFQTAVDKSDSGNIFNFSLGSIAILKGDTASFKSYYSLGLQSKIIDVNDKINKIIPLLMDRDFASKNKDLISYFIHLLEEQYPDDAETNSFLARYYSSIEDKEKELIHVKKAMDAPHLNESLWHDGLLLIIGKQNFEDLVHYGSLAVQYFSGNPFFKLLYAAGLQQLNKEDAAIPILLDAQKIVEGKNISLYVQILSSLGDNYYAVGQKKLAFETYDKALSLDGNCISVLNNYAYYLSEENLELEKAEKMSQKCIELESSNATYLDTNAWVLFKRGRFLEAKFIIERAIDYDESKSSVLVDHYGDILFFNQDVEGAVNQWKKALELNPESKLIMKKIEFKQYFADDVNQ